MLRCMAVSVLVGIFAANAVDAATTTVEARVEFVSRSSIAGAEPAQLRTLDQDSVNSVALLTEPDNSLVDGIDPALAEQQVETKLSVIANTSQRIMIVVDRVENTGGYALTGFQCQYGSSGTAGDCDNRTFPALSGDDATLSVTTKLMATDMPVSGDNSSFDITILYQ